MEIYQLRQFAAVAKTENMTRAAQSLSMAQPAVSKTIRNLESELGAELFERTGKGLRRTEQGDILLRYARAILNAELDARREIEESLHRAGGLCICCTSATPNAGATSMCSSSAALKRIPCVPSARFCAGIFPKSVKRAPQAARSRLHQTGAGFRASTVPCRTLPGR